MNLKDVILRDDHRISLKLTMVEGFTGISGQELGTWKQRRSSWLIKKTSKSNDYLRLPDLKAVANARISYNSRFFKAHHQIIFAN